MRNGGSWKSRAAKMTSCLLMSAAAGLVFSPLTQAENYGVSTACARNYKPNVIQIDGDVNTPVALTVPEIEALPRAGDAQHHLPQSPWRGGNLIRNRADAVDCSEHRSRRHQGPAADPE
jgi:hypothetical protein